MTSPLCWRRRGCGGSAAPPTRSAWSLDMMTADMTQAAVPCVFLASASALACCVGRRGAAARGDAILFSVRPPQELRRADRTAVPRRAGRNGADPPRRAPPCSRLPRRTGCSKFATPPSHRAVIRSTRWIFDCLPHFFNRLETRAQRGLGEQEKMDVGRRRAASSAHVFWLDTQLPAADIAARR